ncbi:hypothetical protein ACFC58_38175 [Kitasatospora purpeofusca]|uniref:hypothetical protein n=1 Tax=Kitasatospora purpeofusca TaxID=67352 RepID=UPI0035D65366
MVRTYFSFLPDLRFALRGCTPAPPYAVAGWTITGTLRGGDTQFPLPLTAGAKVEINGSSVLEFTPDALLARETIYWDTEDFIRQANPQAAEDQNTP